MKATASRASAIFPSASTRIVGLLSHAGLAWPFLRSGQRGSKAGIHCSPASFRNARALQFSAPASVFLPLQSAMSRRIKTRNQSVWIIDGRLGKLSNFQDEFPAGKLFFLRARESILRIRCVSFERESLSPEGGPVLPAGNSCNAGMLIRGCPRVEAATGGPFSEASAIPFVSLCRLLLQRRTLIVEKRIEWIEVECTRKSVKYCARERERERERERLERRNAISKTRLSYAISSISFFLRLTWNVKCAIIIERGKKEHLK